MWTSKFDSIYLMVFFGHSEQEYTDINNTTQHYIVDPYFFVFFDKLNEIVL